MAKTHPTHREFHLQVQERKKLAKLNRSPEQIKRHELELKLKAAHQHGSSQNKRLKEALKQIKYLQDEVKNLKADNENLKEDIRLLQSGIKK